MSKTKNPLVSKSGTKLRSTPAFVAAVTKEFNAGTKLPEAIRKLDATTNEKTIHLASPVYWALEASKLGKIEPTKSAVVAARKSGNRREVVALRAGISVKEVAKLEGSKPVYAGHGTRKHLAPATA